MIHPGTKLVPDLGARCRAVSFRARKLLAFFASAAARSVSRCRGGRWLVLSINGMPAGGAAMNGTVRL